MAEKSKQIGKRKYQFTKMHAYGNDFCVFDFRNEEPNFEFDENQIIILTDRNFGIGCDQLLTIHKCVKPDDEKGTNVMIKIYNQDGSKAMNCGNGIRCIVGYIARESTKPLVRVQVGNKLMLGKPDRNSMFAKVNMGIPTVNGNIVEIGNKHKIEIVDNFDNITTTSDPEYNLHYVQVRSRGEVYMRTIERGSGETLCCGSGSCAVVAYCIANNLTDKNVKVVSRGSDIMDSAGEVSWDGAGKPILLGGHYNFVYTGEIEI